MPLLYGQYVDSAATVTVVEQQRQQQSRLGPSLRPDSGGHDSAGSLSSMAASSTRTQGGSPRHVLEIEHNSLMHGVEAKTSSLGGDAAAAFTPSIDAATALLTGQQERMTGLPGGIGPRQRAYAVAMFRWLRDGAVGCVASTAWPLPTSSTPPHPTSPTHHTAWWPRCSMPTRTYWRQTSQRQHMVRGAGWHAPSASGSPAVLDA